MLLCQAPFVSGRKLLCVFEQPCLSVSFSEKPPLICRQMSPSCAFRSTLHLGSFVAFIYILRASFHFVIICSQKDTVIKRQSELYKGWVVLATVTSSSPFLCTDYGSFYTTPLLPSGPDYTPLLSLSVTLGVNGFPWSPVTCCEFLSSESSYLVEFSCALLWKA